MKNAINILTIILYALELIRKYRMSNKDAAVVTARKFGINPSEVLEAVSQYIKKKGSVK